MKLKLCHSGPQKPGSKEQATKYSSNCRRTKPVFFNRLWHFFSNSLSNQQRRPSINVVRCSFEVNGSCLNLGSKKKSDICSSLKKQKLRSSETPELWSFGAWARSSEARRLRLGRALPVEFSLKLYGKETKKKKNAQQPVIQNAVFHFSPWFLSLGFHTKNGKTQAHAQLSIEGAVSTKIWCGLSLFLPSLRSDGMAKQKYTSARLCQQHKISSTLVNQPQQSLRTLESRAPTFIFLRSQPNHGWNARER